MSSLAASPWRALALLAVLVMAAHALLLGTHPSRFGPESRPSSTQTQVFVTRRLEKPPAPAEVSAPAAPVKPQPKPVAKPVKTPVLKEKEVATQEERAEPAIDSIAATAPAAAEPAASPAEAPAPTPPAAAASAAAAPAGPSLTPVTAMALPASARLAYKMSGSAKGMTYHANAELAWQNSGSSYNARLNVSALFLGSRSMSSSGQVDAEGLAPTRFSDKFRSEVAAHFEPDKGLISFSANTPSVPWLKGAQDRTSVFFQLAGMLAGNPASFPVGSSISLYTVGPRDADTWTFLVEAEEQLQLPFGALATLKLTRQPRREFDQKVEVWYAPALGYLPVRNKISQPNGDFIDQQLTELSKP